MPNTDGSRRVYPLHLLLLLGVAVLLYLCLRSGSPERPVVAPSGNLPAGSGVATPPGGQPPAPTVQPVPRSARLTVDVPTGRSAPPKQVGLGDLSVNMRNAGKEAVYLLLRIAQKKGGAAALDHVRRQLERVGLIADLVDSFAQEMLVRGLTVLVEFDPSLREPVVELLLGLLQNGGARTELKIQALGALFGFGTDDIGLWRFREAGAKPWYYYNITRKPRGAVAATVYLNGDYTDPLTLGVGLALGNRLWTEAGVAIRDLLVNKQAGEDLRRLALFAHMNMVGDRLDVDWLAQLYREEPDDDNKLGSSVRFAAVDGIVDSKASDGKRVGLLLQLVAEEQSPFLKGYLLWQLPKVSRLTSQVVSVLQQNLNTPHDPEADSNDRAITGAIHAFALYAQAGEARAIEVVSALIEGINSGDARRVEMAKDALHYVRELRLKQFKKTLERLKTRLNPGVLRRKVEFALQGL